MLKIDLEKINGRSLMNVFFDIKDKPIKLKDLDYMNLIFSGDGLFLVLKSRFGMTYERTDQPYKNLSLTTYNFDWAFKPLLPKAPKDMFVEILECFKYVVDKTRDELLIIVYYDTLNEKFIMDIVKLQIVAGASVKYAYNKKYEMEERYIKYLEIHSHNTMTAGFSGTDNHDESGRTMYFCGVIGKIDQNSNIYNVDQKFRIWTGNRFRDILPWEVFDVYVPTPGVNEENKKKLDQILTISKIAKENQKPVIIGSSGWRPGNFPTPKDPPTMILPSTGREVEVVRDHMNVFDEVFPTIEDINDMDDDELDKLGIVWDDYDKEEIDQLKELTGEKRGDGSSINGHIPKN
jgi:hypothetical protein